MLQRLRSKLNVVAHKQVQVTVQIVIGESGTGPPSLVTDPSPPSDVNQFAPGIAADECRRMVTGEKEVGVAVVVPITNSAPLPWPPDLVQPNRPSRVHEAAPALPIRLIMEKAAYGLTHEENVLPSVFVVIPESAAASKGLQVGQRGFAVVAPPEPEPGCRGGVFELRDARRLNAFRRSGRLCGARNTALQEARERQHAGPPYD